MDKERAIYFAGLMEEYLNIPSCICENIENELINENYYKVINYVINRRKELENKVNYKTYREFADIVIQLQQENKELKEHIEKYERYCKTTGIEELIKNKKYKEAIDKAIEILEEVKERRIMLLDEEKVLEMLKGVK